MARTLELKTASALPTPTIDLIARGTNVVTETITITEKSVAKRVYTGTIATAAAGDYEIVIKSAGAIVGGDEIRIEDTDATTYRCRSAVNAVQLGGTNITTALFAGITSLAQWLGLMSGKQVGNTTARTELNATGAGSGTYDETTDSPQAIRDRGDAAWVTGSGTTNLSTETTVIESD